mmetsp:Transcript_42976/g.118850  ORF Transcript_42976/g.118850 Transcript_42976/m.118850 type:complete len:327 (+) Transcript_42976:1-981(+)
MGDFGIAKVLECTAACAQTQIGTPYYLSPEICQGKPYAWGSDIWSIGCILFEMCARRVPFDAPDLKSLIQKITRGPPPEVPAEYSAGVRNLCKELLDRDPAKRPPAAEILKRPVVQEMVRRMLDEVKGDESESAPAAREGASRAEQGSSRDGVSAPPRTRTSGGDAHNYQKNDPVEYYSETHKEWLPATITGVDNGKIMLNVKPNVWLSAEVQAAKVRPRQDGAANGRSAHSAGSGGVSRPPAAPSSGGDRGGQQSPSRPSERRNDGRRDFARNPSRDAVPQDRQPAGARDASPRRDLAPAQVRVPSQERRRTPQRQGPSPFRGPT